MHPTGAHCLTLPCGYGIMPPAMLPSMSISSVIELVAVGLGVGAYGTLIGAGGGFLIVPLLLLIYLVSHEQATAISLTVVFFNALSGCFSYARQKRIDYATALRFGVATIPGSIIGAWVSGLVHSDLFRMLFGALLLVMALWLLIKPSLEEGPGPVAHPFRNGVTRTLVDANGQRFRYRFDERVGVVISFFVGFVSSFLGVGGGIIHVPVLVLLFGFPPHIATATSLAILAVSSFTGAATHLFLGNVVLEMALPMALGVVVGAQVGAALALRVQGTWLIRLHAVAISLVGLRLLLG